MPEGAEIRGGVEFHEADIAVHFDDDDAARDVRTVAHGVGSFLWILGVFIAGVLFTLAFPAYSARAADWIGREPLAQPRPRLRDPGLPARARACCC